MKTFILIGTLLAIVFAYLTYVELMTFMAEIALDPNTFKL